MGSKRFIRGAVFLTAAFVTAQVAFARPLPSDADSDKWADNLVDIVSKRDGAAFAAEFDVDAFCDRALANLPGMTPAMRSSFRGGFGGQLGGLMNNIPPDGIFTYLHARPIGEEQHLIFRLIGKAGLNYWDVTVVKDSTGELKIDDMHFAVTGEPLSETTHRLLLRMMMGTDPQNGPTDAEMVDIENVGKATKAAVAGRGDEALKIYDTLPAKYQRDKTTQVMRVMAASHCSDPKKLEEVTDDFKKRFGDDPACDLMLVDTYLARKQWEAAIGCVDRLEKFVNGDPHLDLMRIGIQRLGGMYERAQASALKAHEADPKAFNFVDCLITTSIDLKDFDGVKKWLLVAERDFDKHFSPDLNKADLYAPFMQSPQYQEWLKEREAH